MLRGVTVAAFEHASCCKERMAINCCAVDGHWDLHWRLWSGFMAIAKHCKRVNAAVILEWPKNCEYWNEPAVREFLERLNLSYTEFDGCMYGLMSRFAGVVTLPVRNPWRMACINCDIGK